MPETRMPYIFIWDIKSLIIQLFSLFKLETKIVTSWQFLQILADFLSSIYLYLLFYWPINTYKCEILYIFSFCKEIKFHHLQYKVFFVNIFHFYPFQNWKRENFLITNLMKFPSPAQGPVNNSGLPFKKELGSLWNLKLKLIWSQLIHNPLPGHPLCS